MTTIISRENLLSWLKDPAERFTVVAPVTSGETTLFRPIGPSEVENISLSCAGTDLSAKNWFFPPSESLFTTVRNDKLELVPPKVERDAVLFGLHPCDAKGIALMDRAFLAKPADTFYGEKRERTTLVGLACTTSRPECFCTSMGGGPNDSTHLDILLTETTEGYMVQAVTKKGRQMIEGAPTKEANVEPPKCPEIRPVPVDGIAKKMSGIFENAYWERVADRCLHCNICAYVCPCCYCFDVRDYPDKNKTERIRSWDSCQSPGFTRIAGGYTPRPTKGARLRQRWYHKLLYFPEIFGEVKCTGCGRCVRSCPVNIDIREIITDVQKMKVSDATK